MKHYILFTYLTNRKWKESLSYLHGFNRLLFIILYIPGMIASKKRFGDAK